MLKVRAQRRLVEDHSHDILEGMVNMSKYECPCGYVYDPEVGDPENGIEPGTPFEKLPDDWVCPKCQSEKEFFEKVD